jgi:hypothetical protein
MFIAGQRYQTGLGRADELDDVATRAQQSRVFSAKPSPATAAPLCAQGVDYAWLERSPDPFPPDSVLFTNDSITIVSLAGWACG